MTVLIGDVHGKYTQYKGIIKTHKDSIAIGDMGVGFMNREGQYSANPPYDLMVKQNARFIRGNHDNPGTCKRHTQWIPDGTIENKVMFIGGAYSIDQMYRTENQSWWADEELSTEELNNLVDVAVALKPTVMVTHDCPQDITRDVFLGHSLHKPLYPNRTAQAFSSIRQMCHPHIKLWIFGHWHKDTDVMIDGCRFICLGELQTIDVNFETLEVNPITWAPRQHVFDGHDKTLVVPPFDNF
jgi:hypothetical protein